VPLVRRGLVVLVLLGTLFGLCVWFGTLAPAPERGNYPDRHAVGPAPASYVGSTVVLSGHVVETDPVTMAVPYGVGQHRRFTVTDYRGAVTPGVELRVFGTLTDADTIRADSAFTVSASGNRYMFAVSFLAGLWVLARLCLHWRLDDTDGLTPRATPLSPLRRLRNRFTTPVEDSDDA
jgi:hypothetical protein